METFTVILKSAIRSNLRYAETYLQQQMGIVVDKHTRLQNHSTRKMSRQRQQCLFMSWARARRVFF